MSDARTVEGKPSIRGRLRFWAGVAPMLFSVFFLISGELPVMLLQAILMKYPGTPYNLLLGLAWFFRVFGAVLSAWFVWKIWKTAKPHLPSVNNE